MLLEEQSFRSLDSLAVFANASSGASGNMHSLEMLNNHRGFSPLCILGTLFGTFDLLTPKPPAP